MSEQTTTSSASAEASKAPSTAESQAQSSPPASSTQEAPHTSSDTSKSSSKGKSSSFIKNALSALQGDNQPEAQPEAPAASTPEPKAETSATSETSPKTESKTSPTSADEEDARAEADIKRETANMSSSHKAAFTKLRYEARDLKRQLKAATEAKEQASGEAQKTEANAELERLRSEYDTMKTRMADLEKEAYVGRLELSEKFKTEVEQPRNSVALAVADIAKKYPDLDADLVVASVRSGDADRVSRITADMSEFDRFRFYSLVEQFQNISRVEESMRANARETLEAQARQQREREEMTAAQQKAAWESAVPSAWAKLEEDFPVLAPVEGDEDWNSKIEVLRGFAKPGRFESLTTKEQAETLYRAAAFPVLVAELESAVEELKQAQDKLTKYDSATPEVQSDSSPAPKMGSIGSGNFMDGALAALRKAGSR